MVAQIIDGKAHAAALRARVTAAVPDLAQQLGRPPGLAVILVGEDPASQVYVRNKARETVATGMASFEYKLASDISEAGLLALVAKLNQDSVVDGILVQLPLPKGIDSGKVLASIDPAKDVDGFHLLNVGRLATGLPGLVPCTPLGCLMLLKATLGELAGREAVVLGRSNIVGKPMAQLLLAENCTVTIAHSRSRDLPALIARGDIMVAAVGQPRLVQGAWLKPGACVIDVGINRVAAPELGEGKTRLVGDVDFESACAVAGAITPVPGGVGPMTIACLLSNTLTAAARRAGLPVPLS